MERIFLGWDEPALHAAARVLVEHGRTGDEVRLAAEIVVVPGGRAGRRLLELLLGEAEAADAALAPPRIVTIGALPELLYEPARPLADELMRQRAWAIALESATEDQRRALLRHAAEQTRELAPLGEELARLQRELAGEGWGFAGVAEVVRTQANAAEAARWETLAAIEQQYHEQLAAVGRIDPDQARAEARADGAAEPPSDADPDAGLWLVAVADLPRLTRRMIEQHPGPVRALVHAPESLADRFDELGGVVVEAWAEAPVEIDERQVRVVHRPLDQAMEVLRSIDELDGRLPAEQITVGVCDEQVVSYLEQQLPASEIPVRYAAGVPVGRTAPCRLLAAAADYLEERRFADFAALVRHPDLTDWLLQHSGADGRPLSPDAIDQWLRLMDDYYSEHLQARLTGRWLGRADTRQAMAAVYGAVHHEQLLGPFTGEKRLADWAEPIAQVLRTVYGQTPRQRRDPDDRLIIEVVERLAESLNALARLPERLDEPTEPAAAIRLLLRQVERQSIPPEADEAAVEMLGWLELALDDAEALIVTGFNDGFVPQAVTADLFLPDALRSELGLLDNARRYARDAYALSAILHSRPNAELIAGRVSAEGDPLKPSRLLFATDPARVAERVVRFYGEEAARPRLVAAARLKPAERSAFQLPPEPTLRPPTPITELRVTDFRLALADPYRFCLKRLLGLERRDDAATEMDGAAFGDLGHEVLRRFGLSDRTGETDADRLFAYLRRVMDEVVDERFGGDPLPAIRIQTEQLAARLRAFAAWQAKHAADGWRIERVEASPEHGAAEWVVDGETVHLRGRIDRIDVHPESGRRAVLDYKTSDRADDPERVHRKGRGSSKEWVDLQLPLYRHLVAAMRERESGEPLIDPAEMDALQLGYIALPREAALTGLQPAEWTAEELAEADAVAADVIRTLRGECFTFDPERRAAQPAFFDLADLLGENQLMAADAELAGDDEPWAGEEA